MKLIFNVKYAVEIVGVYIFMVYCFSSCAVVVENQGELIDQGPGPLINGQCEGILDNPVAGAVTCILPDANDAGTVILGTTNGGIWISNNLYTFEHSWTPVGDDLPSMSITSLIRPDVFNGNVIYAGIGNVSSFNSKGGRKLGILKSIDSGLTWQLLPSNLTGRNVFDIGFTFYNPTYNPDLVNGEYVNMGNFKGSLFAATDNGLYVSYDEGTFNQITQLPQSRVSDVYSEGKGPELFVAVPGDSVYVSQDFGQTFRGLDLDVSTAINIKISLTSKFLVVARADTTKGDTFCKVDILDRFTFVNVVRNNRGPFTDEDLFAVREVGPFTAEQKGNHFSLVTYEPGDGTTEIFIGGVLNKELVFGSTGQSNYTGRLFIGLMDANLNINWKPIVGNGAYGTAPHADSRCMAIDANGDLLQGCDGGIYRFYRTSPETSNIRKWISINYNLRVSEVTSVGWDSKNNVAIAGLQDNGSVEQMVSAFSDDEKVWTDARLFTFFGLNLATAVGDGFAVNVDNQHDPPVRYIMTNHFTKFYKREYSEINPAFIAPWSGISFNQNCSPFDAYCALHPLDKADAESNEEVGLFPFELNAVNQSKFVIGARGVYAFSDYGNQLAIVDTSETDKFTGAVAYGHADNADILYFAKSFDSLIHVRQGVDDPVITREVLSNPRSIRSIAIDVDNADDIYFVAKDSLFLVQGFSTDNPIITNLQFDPYDDDQSPLGLSTVQSLEIEVDGDTESVLLVACLGGVYIRNNQFGNQQWLPVATNFPYTLVSDFVYNKEDDILVVGTLGRGVWTLEHFSEHIPRLRLSF